MYKLAPGHSVSWHDGVIEEPQPFWCVSDAALREVPRRGLAERVWATVEESVLRQLVSDVPVGILLSGGIDSSAIAVSAQRHLQHPLLTFFVGFRQKSFDETPYATLVAREIGSEHHSEIFDEQRMDELLPEALNRLDEPLADHSYLPCYALARLAARHVKVVLAGDGGDELWGGYPTYQAHRYGQLYGRTPKLLRRLLVNGVLPRLPYSPEYQDLLWLARRFCDRWDDDMVRRHMRWMAGTDLPALLEAMPWARDVLPATLRASFAPLRDPLEQVISIDLQTYLPASVLTKADRSSMAHGLEVRPPLLDNELVDLALAIRSDQKVRFGETKHIFKRAAQPHLPRTVVRRRKQGFSIPVWLWIKGPFAPFVEQAFDNPVLWGDGKLCRNTFRRWHGLHQAGRADFGKSLWALIVLDHWVRQHDVQG